MSDVSSDVLVRANGALTVGDVEKRKAEWRKMNAYDLLQTRRELACSLGEASLCRQEAEEGRGYPYYYSEADKSFYRLGVEGEYEDCVTLLQAFDEEYPDTHPSSAKDFLQQY